MRMILVNGSFWEISFYAPGPVFSYTAVRNVFTEAKDKNNVCKSYIYLLNIYFLSKRQTDMVYDCLWYKLLVWQPD